jgi:hypothetical protein
MQKHLDELAWKRPTEKVRGAPEWEIHVFDSGKKKETYRVFFRGMFVRDSDGMIALDKTGFWVRTEERIARDPKWKAILGER